MSQPTFLMRGLAALLAATFAGIGGAQEASPGAQWLSYNNHLDGQRFSALKQITPANATQLGEVCRVQIDGPTSLHSDLIVADGVIYTGTGSETVAIDATRCTLIWRHSYTPDDDRSSPSTRGVAVMNGRLFRGTSDDRLIALDAATGKLLWKTVIGSPALGESSAAAPLAWGGVVYMGISGSELGARGRVMAFDAQTGRELWRFNTIPMGKEVGSETWERPGTAKTGGGGIWGAMTLDVSAGELFVPVGNPWPDIDKAYRPGANLFTDSIVVLDARTGALKWWHQGTPEDWMDLDMVAPPVLYRIDGARDYLVFGGKDGYVTAVDRDSHQQLFRVPVTTIERAPKMPTKEGMRMCPGYAGGVEWNGPAYDRLNHSLVTGAVDACFTVKLGAAAYAPGAVNFGGTVEPVGPTTGWITSIDSVTGAVRWKFHADKPVVAGITPTAGGGNLRGRSRRLPLCVRQQEWRAAGQGPDRRCPGRRSGDLRAGRAAICGLCRRQHLPQCVRRAGPAQCRDHGAQPQDRGCGERTGSGIAIRRSSVQPGVCRLSRTGGRDGARPQTQRGGRAAEPGRNDRVHQESAGTDAEDVSGSAHRPEHHRRH
ncbi:MAG: PQQ-binding-like beta-propeller repeat protein [Steroidobacteraceae bacterium]